MTATRRYNKRQLKKKHLGEFQELCFLFDAKLVRTPSLAERDALFDQFLAEAIEANGLEFGGGGGIDDFGGYVGSAKRYGKVDDSHRAMIQEWLMRHGLLTDVKVGELRDAWYGWD